VAQIPYTLYGRPDSGSFVVAVALEEIGEPFEWVSVDRGAEAIAEYCLINPTGKVPALRLPNGTVLFESAAILMHLALTHPAARLAPNLDELDYALFLQWIVYLAANPYQSILRIYYPERYSARGETDASLIREQGVIDLESQLRFLNSKLDPYLLGPRYSILDAYLCMLVSWYPGNKAPLLGALNRLDALVKLVALRPAVSKAERLHGSMVTQGAIGNEVRDAEG
jgi:glutathione S-transferase